MHHTETFPFTSSGGGGGGITSKTPFLIFYLHPTARVLDAEHRWKKVRTAQKQRKKAKQFPYASSCIITLREKCRRLHRNGESTMQLMKRVLRLQNTTVHYLEWIFNDTPARSRAPFLPLSPIWGHFETTNFRTPGEKSEIRVHCQCTGFVSSSSVHTLWLSGVWTQGYKPTIR